MSQNTIIIGIAGPSASGKSLLARTLVEEVHSTQVAVIPEDSYYRDRRDIDFESRKKINYDHPSAFEHSLMIEHLKALRAGGEAKVPTYDYSQHLRREDTRTVNSCRIVVLEGILLFVEPRLLELMDIKIFMDTPLDICLIRRMNRDIHQRGRSLESVLQQYQETVRPMFFQFIEPSKVNADIIVPRGGENRIAIDMIKAKMDQLI
jgi:uridine kinase